MFNVVSVRQMKKIEELAVEAGTSYLQLMENAGFACAYEILKSNYIINTHFVILCGSGNNGGDGFMIAQRLYEKGANICVVLCNGFPTTQESQTSFSRLNKHDISILNLSDDYNLIMKKLAECDFTVDCIYGTGFRGEIVPPLKNVIERANLSKSINFAIDIPSGINADTGEIGGIAFKSNYTYILGAYKKAHTLSNLQSYFGETELIDIGIPMEAFDQYLIQSEDITPQLIENILPKRDTNSHKGDYGKLLNISGSIGMGGAAIMSTLSALRSGVGLVCLATPKAIALNSFSQIIEATTLPLTVTSNGTIHRENIANILEKLKTSTACLIGCGLGKDENTMAILKAVVENATIPVIIDADGINCLADDINIIKNTKAKIIITPHPMEMSRLTNISVAEIQENRLKVAHDFSVENNVTTILKGFETIVSTPKGELYKNTTGNAGMAKGGSGDVLAGILSSIIAQGIPVDKASIFSVFVHGICGDICAKKLSQTAMLPRDIINELPLVFQKLDR